MLGSIFFALFSLFLPARFRRPSEKSRAATTTPGSPVKKLWSLMMLSLSFLPCCTNQAWPGLPYTIPCIKVGGRPNNGKNINLPWSRRQERRGKLGGGGGRRRRIFRQIYGGNESLPLYPRLLSKGGGSGSLPSPPLPLAFIGTGGASVWRRWETHDRTATFMIPLSAKCTGGVGTAR